MSSQGVQMKHKREPRVVDGEDEGYVLASAFSTTPHQLQVI